LRATRAEPHVGAILQVLLGSEISNANATNYMSEKAGELYRERFEGGKNRHEETHKTEKRGLRQSNITVL